MSTVLATTLVRTPGVCGGRLRIDGTRMPVGRLVLLYKEGHSPEQIIENYPHLSGREVYAVLAWYHEHREEFDAELEAEAAEDRAAYEAWQASQR
jgi:uncharacterized protein (DUF433 family)